MGEINRFYDNAIARTRLYSSLMKRGHTYWQMTREEIGVKQPSPRRPGFRLNAPPASLPMANAIEIW
jgi:hypothetical protein